MRTLSKTGVSGRKIPKMQGPRQSVGQAGNRKVVRSERSRDGVGWSSHNGYNYRRDERKIVTERSLFTQHRNTEKEGRPASSRLALQIRTPEKPGVGQQQQKP